MATSDDTLVSEVRSFAQYKPAVVSDEDLSVAVKRAKSHLLSEAPLQSEDVDWYGDDNQEEALFWASMLFSKVQTGALDAKAISVGAIEESELLAQADGEITMWYENYAKAKQILILNSGGGTRVSRSARTSTGGQRSYTKREEL